MKIWMLSLVLCSAASAPTAESCSTVAIYKGVTYEECHLLVRRWTLYLPGRLECSPMLAPDTDG